MDRTKQRNLTSDKFEKKTNYLRTDDADFSCSLGK